MGRQKVGIFQKYFRQETPQGINRPDQLSRTDRWQSFARETTQRGLQMALLFNHAREGVQLDSSH